MTSGDHVMVDGEQIRLTAYEAHTNLRTMLELCAAGKVRCSAKTGRPSAATMAALSTHLVQGDFYPDEPIASFAWPLIIQAGGLARVESGRLQLTAKGRTALSKPPADVIRELWRRWLTHALLDEFQRIEEIKGQRSANVLTAARPRRELVSRALAAICPVGEWLTVDALFSAMRRRSFSPMIVRNERALWKLYLVDAQYGSLGYDGYYRWSMVEGRYTLAVLFEYAATLGLIDIDYVDPVGARDDFRDNCGGDDLEALSRYDGLLAVRLNELGCYVLGLTETYSPPADDEQSTLRLLPSLEIVPLDVAPSSGAVLMLSAYAQRTGDQVWTVSTESLLVALDAGRDVAEFEEFLTRNADTELLGEFTAVFDDVAHRATQLVDLGHVRVVECIDPAVATLIAGDRALRGVVRQLSERHLAVPLESESEFRTTLRQLGYVVPAGPH